jgi:hypothetical protein
MKRKISWAHNKNLLSMKNKIWRNTPDGIEYEKKRIMMDRIRYKEDPEYREHVSKLRLEWQKNNRNKCRLANNESYAKYREIIIKKRKEKYYENIELTRFKNVNRHRIYMIKHTLDNFDTGDINILKCARCDSCVTSIDNKGGRPHWYTYGCNMYICKNCYKKIECLRKKIFNTFKEKNK